MNHIPEKLPKGTTQEQWDRYYEDMKKHVEHVEREKPFIQDYGTEDEFMNAYSDWQMMSSCNEPNKPGYYRANND